MTRIPQNRRTFWPAAIEQALDGVGDPESGVCLFHEERQDVTVEARDGSGPTGTSTRGGGLSARGPFPSQSLSFLTAAAPEQASAVLAGVLGKGFEPRENTREAAEAEADPSPATDVESATRCVEQAVRDVRRELPDVRVRARWIGFVQRICVGHPGRPAALDERRGARIHIAAYAPVWGDSCVAVREAVLGHPSTRPAIIRELAAQVCERLRATRRIEAAAGGEQTVVFAPGVGGVLVHEIVGHALEADVTSAGGSWLSDAGGAVAPDALTVIDDPRRARASWRIDDEGQPAQATPLIRNGRVAGRLHDLRSAREAAAAPTGHGRRASFKDAVKPRMGCTFVAAGPTPAQEIVAGVQRGVYVRRMEAASTDAASGRAVFRVTEADAMSNGAIDRALEPFLLWVDARSALASMDRVGDDIAFDTCIGSCHRGGQHLPVSVGAPTICIGVARVMS